MVFHRPAIKEDAAGSCSGRGPVPRFEPDPGRVPPPSLRARLRQGWASSPPPRPGPMEWTDESRQPMRGLHRGRVRRVVRRLRDACGGRLAQRRAAVCERLPARAAHRIPDGCGPAARGRRPDRDRSRPSAPRAARRSVRDRGRPGRRSGAAAGRRGRRVRIPVRARPARRERGPRVARPGRRAPARVARGCAHRSRARTRFATPRADRGLARGRARHAGARIIVRPLHGHGLDHVLVPAHVGSASDRDRVRDRRHGAAGSGLAGERGRPSRDAALVAVGGGGCGRHGHDRGVAGAERRPARELRLRCPRAAGHAGRRAGIHAAHVARRALGRNGAAARARGARRVPAARDRGRPVAAGGAREAAERGALPARGARDDRCAVELGSRERRPVVEPRLLRALPLSGGARGTRSRVQDQPHPSRRSRARAARRAGGDRWQRRSVVGRVPLPLRRRRLRVRVRPGVHRARSGGPSRAGLRLDDRRHSPPARGGGARPLLHAVTGRAVHGRGRRLPQAHQSGMDRSARLHGGRAAEPAGHGVRSSGRPGRDRRGRAAAPERRGRGLVREPLPPQGRLLPLAPVAGPAGGGAADPLRLRPRRHGGKADRERAGSCA